MTGNNWSFTIGSSPTLLIGSNPKRQRIIVSNNSGNNITLLFRDTNGSANFGLKFPSDSNYPPYVIRREDIGDLIEQALYGWAASTSTSITIVEVMS